MAGRGRTLLGALRVAAGPAPGETARGRGGGARGPGRCLGIPRSSPVQPARPFLIPAGTGSSRHWEQRVLGYSAEQMYALVANVGEYRLFVPWCSRLATLSRRGQVLRAELEVGFPPFLERYVSEVFLGSWRIWAVSRDCRLFRHLETLWRFGPGLPGRTDTCLLDFSVSFEFRLALHSRLASPFLDEVAKRTVAAFEDRAQALFGPQAAVPPRRPCAGHEDASPGDAPRRLVPGGYESAGHRPGRGGWRCCCRRPLAARRGGLRFPAAPAAVT
ncbi:coenzyme Q-binding protein COQ10 homolog B, mitochondrial-like [Pelecanus crispus]|uniref:coenzyme Q-binding protein COQ10 homolog B, mitochondrial-like n=1 Tax=Pelecanus crispus TaxID=36300 RepID=UPI003F5D26F0